MKKQAIAGLVVSAVLLTSPVLPTHGYAATNSFTDIENSFAKDAINTLQQAGIISGFGNGTYNPTGTLTREQFAKILVLSNGLDISNPPRVSTYSDVSTNSWAFPYVEAAVKAGYIKGYTDGTFKGGTNLSREHMAVMFVRSLGVDVTGYGSKLTFNDSGSISNSYKDAIAFSVEAGLISGKKDGKFDPKGNATREQVAKVAATFIKVKDEIKKPISTPDPDPKPLPIQNHAPVASLIEAKSIIVDQHLNVLNVASVFTDRDGDTLTFTASSSNTNIATVSLDGNNLYVTGISLGTCTITLTADDRRGGVTTKTFDLTVSLSPQELAIKKIDEIIKDGDASEISLNDINSALLGKSVSTIEGNLDVYRDVISRTENLELNSADKIADMVTDVNTTLDKEITTGITVTGGTNFKYHLLIDPVAFNVVSASKVISWATPMDDTFTNSNIYTIMKKVASYDSKYFFSIPTATPLSLKPKSVGTYQVLFIYVDQDKQSQGYSVHNSITVTNNNPPMVSDQWTVPDFTVGEDAPLNLIGLFTDDDDDELTYSIEALNKDIADIFDGEENALPTIHPLASGTAQFKVTVDDGRGGTNETTISVIITQAIGNDGDENSTPEVPTVPVNTDINLQAIPGSLGSGEINVSWDGNNDPNWSHYEMYKLVSETGEADDTIPKYADLTYRGSDGFGDEYLSGTRVSYALYSVMNDGSKTVQKVTVVAP
ncbi:S-layer homology domain-containing protein [Bacillus cihuensis]|uniref:S-layer homology domain-containing protein n=1 Tax=Bacillus cihuensis TaxID=1208599 RepID=UPI0003F58DE7|nr:S-layer homology domain-containing protein [Bacillus cihuensis]